MHLPIAFHFVPSCLAGTRFAMGAVTDAFLCESGFAVVRECEIG